MNHGDKAGSWRGPDVFGISFILSVLLQDVFRRGVRSRQGPGEGSDRQSGYLLLQVPLGADRQTGPE